MRALLPLGRCELCGSAIIPLDERDPLPLCEACELSEIESAESANLAESARALLPIAPEIPSLWYLRKA